MNRSIRTWIVPLLLGTAVITALAVMKRGNPAEQHPLDQAAVERRHEQIHPTANASETVRLSLSCSGPQLEIETNDKVESACMGALITKYNGSVRSHQIATLTAPQRWLRVEVAGGSILSAAWGSELKPDFQCQAAECKGITISRRDAQGAREMSLDRTSLRRTHLKGMPPSQALLQLSGQIEIPAETRSELACADQGVSIVTSDSSSQTFCPQGGAGFEIVDDGTRRYRFTSLDGESILIATDQHQQIRQVRYEGEVSLACGYAECGSVRMSLAGAQGARRFTFSGTTLIDTNSGQSNAVLNGSLLLPPM